MHTSVGVRVAYAIIFVLFVVLAWVIRDFGYQLLSHISVLSSECPTERCYGSQGVLRISFALFLFYIGMSIALIGHKKHDQTYFRTRLQDGMWYAKIPVLVVLMVVSLFLPNALMTVYGYAAAVGATFFLFVQIVLLIDFAYDSNDRWVEKEHYKRILALAIFMYVSSAVGIVLMYVWFSQCGLNIFFITFTVVVCIIFSLLSIRENVERGALLTSAVVTGYCTYVLFSAISSSTDTTCNPFSPASHTAVWLLVIGVVIAIVSIGWSTIRAASTSGFFEMRHKEVEETTSLLEAHEDDCYNFSFFHLIFACGSMYMAMLFTAWNFVAAEQTMYFDIGPVSMWVKIVSQWVTMGLYVWSLIGPLVCGHRDWS